MKGIDIIRQKQVNIFQSTRQKQKKSCTIFYGLVHKNILTHFDPKNIILLLHLRTYISSFDISVTNIVVICRYSMKKNTNIRVFKHTRRAIIRHIVILYVSKINTSLTLKVKCVKKFKYIPGHFHKIFKSGLHLENQLAILLTNFKI